MKVVPQIVHYATRTVRDSVAKHSESEPRKCVRCNREIGHAAICPVCESYATKIVADAAAEILIDLDVNGDGDGGQQKVYRLTIANITRQDLIAACKATVIQGATIYQGSGYCAEYAEGATEYSFTVETVCSLTVARALWIRVAALCDEDSIYVTVNGSHAALWYRDNRVDILCKG